LHPFTSIDAVEKIVHVSEVEHLGGFRLRLVFDDGVSGELDFSNEEWRGVFSPLTDVEYFGRVVLDKELGTIVWPNGADFAPETLHLWVTQTGGLPASR
jgi:hypothetical protein